jgi:hypothetical protein
VTKAIMHRLGGLLVLLSGRMHGQVFISILAYQPGRPNSNDDLRRDLSGALNDFSLTATIGWPCPMSVAGARVPTTSGWADAIANQVSSSELYDLTA